MMHDHRAIWQCVDSQSMKSLALAVQPLGMERMIHGRSRGAFFLVGKQ
jgi:hypothetical protein